VETSADLIRPRFARLDFSHEWERRAAELQVMHHRTLPTFPLSRARPFADTESITRPMSPSIDSGRNGSHGACIQG